MCVCVRLVIRLPIMPSPESGLCWFYGRRLTTREDGEAQASNLGDVGPKTGAIVGPDREASFYPRGSEPALRAGGERGGL
ncbi:hypothetical protein FKM82_018740 [Ascaphus truei]